MRIAGARCRLLVLVVAAGMQASALAEPATAAAKASLYAQVDAWNRGDLASALATYLDDPSMTWVNGRGVSRGFDAFAAEMRAQFGTEPASMGRSPHAPTPRHQMASD